MSYIAIEGLDFSGKSTLVDKISERFKSRVVQEPFSESLVAYNVRRDIRGAIMEPVYETQLLIAGRVELFTKLNNYMRPDSPTVLVSDRSFITNMVYQSRSDTEADRILNLNKQVLKIYGFNIFPHLVVYLKVPYEVALERASQRSDFNKRDELVLYSKNRYEEMQERYEYSLKLVKCYSPDTRIVTSVYEPGEDNTMVIFDIIEQVLNANSSIPVKQYA